LAAAESPDEEHQNPPGHILELPSWSDALEWPVRLHAARRVENAITGGIQENLGNDR